MPVSLATARDPFRGVAPQPVQENDEPALRPAQARVLAALLPSNPSHPAILWPLYSRNALKERLGYSPTNSLNRLLNHHERGLLQLGLIETVDINIDGIHETNYRITLRGIECLSRSAPSGSRSDSNGHS